MAKYTKKYSKITNFKYSGQKHQRSENPPIFNNYRQYKPYLKKEFFNKCVYCRKFDALEDKAGFHVEHYRPKDKKFFPSLINNYSNLYYSCASCNRFKGNYWSEVPSEQVVNPCDFIMSQHLKFDISGNIKHLSDSGKKTIEILNLNNDDSMKYRDITRKMVMQFLSLLGTLNVKSQKSEVNDSIDLLSKILGENPDIIKAALSLKV